MNKPEIMGFEFDNNQLVFKDLDGKLKTVKLTKCDLGCIEDNLMRVIKEKGYVEV